MPTHKDLPDAYLNPARHQRGRRFVRALLFALVIGGVIVGYYRVSRSQPSRNHAQLSSAPNNVRDRSTPDLPARPPTTHVASSQPAAAVKAPPWVRTTPERLNPARPVPARPADSLKSDVRVLAVGVSESGGGSPPLLVALARSSSVTIRSRSGMPLEISVNAGYGRPMRRWITLARGGTMVRTVKTGTPYGYCFSQSAGDGYAATRACGVVTMHQYLNGTRLPDGPGALEQFDFTSR